MTRKEFDISLYHIIFGDLRKYQNLIETFLSTQKKELEENTNEVDVNDQMNDSEKYEKYLDLIGTESYEKFEKYHDIARLFPHNFRVSFLTQVISVIEKELKRLCNDLGNIKNQTFMVADLKGSNDFLKCKEYLKKISSIDFNSINAEWEYILQCKSLRNNLVHSGNIIKMDNKKLVNFIKNNDSFDCEYEEFIDKKEDIVTFVIVNSKLIDKLINQSQKLFENLLGLKYNS
ncbi:abortive infection bacteriophage resistance protein, AbiH superfamily [Psychroflexus torquis ATCC 700755]|uniref:Abortive infection bacteriophage resistance protein, AbiH superfamily n=2 Tax=Psychroflexus TaxID=83612 RepID=K4IDS1_PSYTT|nr:hypothetical protein [Psychroflexus torquis]AFU68737.1 abortive infection bacteriophage resistance protein, AbiH superfamily [Psychroflexus torquis ATCC 700755]